jgi:hypothetical protein
MEYRDTDAGPIQTDVSKGGLSRRQALKSLGAAGIAAATMPFLGGATRADMSGQLIGPGGIPLARPAHPVKLPVFEDPINSGLQPETGGTFRVFMYADYIDKKLLATFGKKYDVDVEVTTFISMDQAITRLATHAVEVNAFNITPDRVAQAVAGKLLKPVNPDYIPNLKKNIWPSLHSPFYDVGSQYTVPYVATPLASPGAATRSPKTYPSSKIPGRSSGMQRNTKAMSGFSMTPASRLPWPCFIATSTTSTRRIPRSSTRRYQN